MRELIRKLEIETQISEQNRRQMKLVNEVNEKGKLGLLNGAWIIDWIGVVLSESLSWEMFENIHVKIKLRNFHNVFFQVIKISKKS
jgi:hydroxymethylpyrimidine pyrophosphatase-like HAD family hydrolase